MSFITTRFNASKLVLNRRQQVCVGSRRHSDNNHCDNANDDNNHCDNANDDNNHCDNDENELPRQRRGALHSQDVGSLP